jgi:hypothetical protein
MASYVDLLTGRQPLLRVLDDQLQPCHAPNQTFARVAQAFRSARIAFECVDTLKDGFRDRCAPVQALDKVGAELVW